MSKALFFLQDQSEYAYPALTIWSICYSFDELTYDSANDHYQLLPFLCCESLKFMAAPRYEAFAHDLFALDTVRKTWKSQ